MEGAYDDGGPHPETEPQQKERDQRDARHRVHAEDNRVDGPAHGVPAPDHKPREDRAAPAKEKPEDDALKRDQQLGPEGSRHQKGDHLGRDFRG